MQRFIPIYLSVFLSALAYGITFPLFSLQLERMGVSPELMGVNAAMPALGWLLVSPLVPRLQAWVGVKLLIVGFLFIAAIGFFGISSSHDYTTITVMRLAFGGAIGMCYRLVEYSLNALSGDHDRGRNLGVYSVLYLLAIGIGATVQPSLGTTGSQVESVVMLLIAGAAVPLLALQVPAFERNGTRPTISARQIALAPVAFTAALVFGLFESIPAYLLPVYAVKNGFGDEMAAYTISAATLGALAGPLLIGIFSDRYGRLSPIFWCAAASTLASLLIPLTHASALAFLGAVTLLGFTASCIYFLALSMIGDRWRGSDLVEANAAFGFVYAVGSLVGPLVNGAALGTLQTHGLMVSSSLLFLMLVIGIAIQHLRQRLGQRA